MSPYREHPRDVEPAEWFEYEKHAKDCACDACAGAYEMDEQEPGISRDEEPETKEVVIAG